MIAVMIVNAVSIIILLIMHSGSFNHVYILNSDDSLHFYLW